LGGNVLKGKKTKTDEDEMEEHTLKNEYRCWNTNITFYLETSGEQNSNLYLDVVQFFNAMHRHLRI